MWQLKRDAKRGVLVLAVLALMALVLGCPPSPPPPDPQPKDMGTATSEATEPGVTVELRLTEGSEPEKPELSASGPENHIRWKNTTTEERTVVFTGPWPFYGSKQDIVIAAGAMSPWFTLDPAKVPVTAPYQVNPSLIGSDGTPDEPAVTGGN